MIQQGKYNFKTRKQKWKEARTYKQNKMKEKKALEGRVTQICGLKILQFVFQQ